jgi:hypothetical protein
VKITKIVTKKYINTIENQVGKGDNKIIFVQKR